MTALLSALGGQRIEWSKLITPRFWTPTFVHDVAQMRIPWFVDLQLFYIATAFVRTANHLNYSGKFVLKHDQIQPGFPRAFTSVINPVVWLFLVVFEPENRCGVVWVDTSSGIMEVFSPWTNNRRRDEGLVASLCQQLPGTYAPQGRYTLQWYGIGNLNTWTESNLWVPWFVWLRTRHSREELQEILLQSDSSKLSAGAFGIMAIVCASILDCLKAQSSVLTRFFEGNGTVDLRAEDDMIRILREIKSCRATANDLARLESVEVIVPTYVPTVWSKDPETTKLWHNFIPEGIGMEPHFYF